MPTRDEAGFTLIEVMMALAISGGLILLVFSGQRNLRATFQFADGIERTINTLTGVRNEALTTVATKAACVTTPAQCGNGQVGATTDNSIIGKQITFKSNSSQIEIRSLVLDATGSITTTDLYTVSLPWGITYANAADSTFVYARNFDTGELMAFSRYGTATLNNDTPLPAFDPTNYSTYLRGRMSNLTPNKFPFTDPDGRTACVTMNPYDGSLVRAIDVPLSSCVPL